MTQPDARIGSTLRQARERIGLTINQVAAQLNLDVALVTALEEERFAALGAPVFVRGHLKRYADLLGEALDPLQERYAEHLSQGSGEPDLTQVPRGVPVPDPRSYLLPAVILAGVLVLGGIVWWALTAAPAG
jgi:cytoskeleton protein RodZ